MNSTKWSRPAQQSERVLICKQPWGCWGARTHTFEHACTQTHSLRNANFSLYSILKRKMSVVCVCVRRLCRMSEVIEMLHILSCTGGIIGPCSLMDTLFLPLPSISLPHIQLQTVRQIGAPICVCVCAFIFVGMCVFTITQWEEHQLLRIKTLALKKLLHFKLQT